jgi:hypothetical protein
VVAVDGNPTKLPGTFAADRHEYDRLSEVIVALQIDSFKDATAVKRAPRWIQLERVDRFGTRTTLTTAGNEGPFFTPGGAPDPEPILIGKLTYDPLRISLSKYDIRAGDTLRLKVVDQDVGGDTIDGAALEVPIVAKPVIPVPEAAYALLRSESDDRTAVSCARFAWSPQATRIDLLDPAQLFSSLVERRAVFQWNAAFAFDRANAWAVQKTTFQGSTYIPQLIAAENGG